MDDNYTNPYMDTLTQVPLQTAFQTSAYRYARTPVSDLFFQPQNILYLQSQLNKILTLLIGQPVQVPANNEMIQTMNDIITQNPGLANMGQDGLNQLNQMLLEWEARIQYVSLRQQKLYEQYYIASNRMVVMPYPKPDKTMKGEVVLDFSGYNLHNPWGREYGTFLHDVLRIGAPKCEPQSSQPAFPRT